MSTAFRLDDGDLAFGRDLGLGKLELQQISGTDSLMQALVLRVQTPLGNDRFNTAYGLDLGAAFIQPATVSAVQGIIKLNLVQTLGTDPRVSDVVDVQFVTDPAYRARHPEVSDADVRNARAQRVWPVDVLVRTADGVTRLLSTKVGV
jgi:hypothetical protein